MPDAVDDARTRELQQVLTALSHLLTRPVAHDWLVSRAGVAIGRSDLHLLDALDHEGGNCRVGDLAGRLLVEPSHVTRQVAGLQEQGLVERTPDREDRRARNVALTPLGSTVLARLRAAYRASLDLALDGADPADVDATVRVLRRLVERYAEAVRDG